jgi:hypothetical protein
MDLLDLGEGKYSFSVGNSVRNGDLKTIAKLALNSGIDLEEFEMALLEMNKNNHKRANFGFYGTFIFSTEK